MWHCMPLIPVIDIKNIFQYFSEKLAHLVYLRWTLVFHKEWNTTDRPSIMACRASYLAATSEWWMTIFISWLNIIDAVDKILCGCRILLLFARSEAYRFGWNMENTLQGKNSVHAFGYKSAEWTDLDEIWSTVNTLLGTGPGLFWAQSAQ